MRAWTPELARRGRGLAVYLTAMFGALTIGSIIWGQVAALAGVVPALLVASAGALVIMPLLWRWRLPVADEFDLAPSMHWPAPIVSGEVEPDRGPVMVSVEYRIAPADAAEFLLALERLSHERRRDGAYDCAVFEDPAVPGRFVEAFRVASWLEHLRQHERVTNADRQQQELVNRFQHDGAPKVQHLLATSAAHAAGPAPTGRT